MIRYRYIVEDIDFKGQEKIFETNWHTSLGIDTHLMQGSRTLKIERRGTGKETKYIVTKPDYCNKI